MTAEPLSHAAHDSSPKGEQLSHSAASRAAFKRRSASRVPTSRRPRWPSAQAAPPIAAAPPPTMAVAAAGWIWGCRLSDVWGGKGGGLF